MGVIRHARNNNNNNKKKIVDERIREKSYVMTTRTELGFSKIRLEKAQSILEEKVLELDKFYLFRGCTENNQVIRRRRREY